MARSSSRRTDAQWQAAINRNRALSKVSGSYGAVQIYKGRYFYPLQPKNPANDIDIETIAHALAALPRWGGHTCDEDGSPLRFSIAQHSVYISLIVEQNKAKLVPKWDWSKSGNPGFYALIHDSPEAYGLADLVRPIKHLMDDYVQYHDALLERIIEALDVPIDPAIREAVRRVDNMMVFVERDAFMGQPVNPYDHEAQHPYVDIGELIPNHEIWSAARAKEEFIERWDYLKWKGSRP